jgi:hypothetical protein
VLNNLADEIISQRPQQYQKIQMETENAKAKVIKDKEKQVKRLLKSMLSVGSNLENLSIELYQKLIIPKIKEILEKCPQTNKIAITIQDLIQTWEPGGFDTNEDPYHRFVVNFIQWRYRQKNMENDFMQIAKMLNSDSNAKGKKNLSNNLELKKLCSEQIENQIKFFGNLDQDFWKPLSLSNFELDDNINSSIVIKTISPLEMSAFFLLRLGTLVHEAVRKSGFVVSDLVFAVNQYQRGGRSLYESSSTISKIEISTEITLPEL